MTTKRVAEEPTTIDGPRYQQYMPLDDLLTRRDPRNAKLHDTAGIGASMERHGYIEPVALDERTGLLISGHGRVEWLDEIRTASAEPPEGIVKADDGQWHVPVDRGWSSADDDEAETALIGLNQLTSNGGWDINRLHDQLSRLSGLPSALSGVGFTDKDIERLKRQIEQASPTQGGGDPQLGDLEYRLIVQVSDEETQRTLMAELEERGYAVQLIIS